jgi:ferredoxin
VVIDTPNGASLPSGEIVRGEERARTHAMKVWIDQDLCTGDGLCEEIAPAVFTLLDDGLAYVKDADAVKNDPGGSAGMALVPEDLEDAVTEAAEECPGECIFIEQG